VNTELAYDFCEAVTRQEAKNFAYGTRLLRKPERRALSSVYALARRIDDIGDGRATSSEKLAGLQALRNSIDPIDPETTDPVLVAVADAARRYGLAMSCFGEIIDGCEMDVIGTSYETIDDLVGYCRKVAGSVGRLSLAIFGSRDPEKAVPLAARSAWRSSSPTSCATSSRTVRSGVCTCRATTPSRLAATRS